MSGLRSNVVLCIYADGENPFKTKNANTTDEIMSKLLSASRVMSPSVYVDMDTADSGTKRLKPVKPDIKKIADLSFIEGLFS